MRCLSCGSGAGFRRLIVLTDSLEREGGLCSSCEWKLEQLFLNEHVDDESEQHGDDQDHVTECIRCGKTGRFALPEMEVSVDVDVNANKILYDFEVDDDTPRLCTDHLEFFLESPRKADPLNMLDERL